VGLRGDTAHAEGLLPRVARRCDCSHVLRRDSLGVRDVIEVDPARRVRLKIEHEAPVADASGGYCGILEELAPAERR